MKTKDRVLEEKKILYGWGGHGLHCWKLGYRYAEKLVRQGDVK